MRRALWIAPILGLVLAGCPREPRDRLHDTFSMGQIAVDPVNPSTVLAVHQSRLERTTDAGLTWQSSGGDPAVQSVAWTGSRAWVLGIAALGTINGVTVYTATDHGLTFNPVAPLPRGTSQAVVGADWTNAGHAVVVGAPYVVFGGALMPVSGSVAYMTSNAGATWQTATIASLTFPALGRPHSVRFDPTNGSSVWAAFDGGLLRSRDGGASFTAVTSLSVVQVQDLAAVGSTVYIAAYPDLIVSTDGGATFIARPVGAPPIALAVDPSSPSTVYVMTTVGLYRSVDSGRTYSFLYPGNGEGPVALAPSNRNVVYIEGFTSQDAGFTWFSLAPFDWAPAIGSTWGWGGY